MGSEVTCFTNSVISRPLTLLISVLLFSFIYHNGQKNCEKCSTSEPRVTPKASYCIGIRSAKLLILRKESVLHNKKKLAAYNTGVSTYQFDSTAHHPSVAEEAGL